jgi:hypothetical protein
MLARKRQASSETEQKSGTGNAAIAHDIIPTLDGWSRPQPHRP